MHSNQPRKLFSLCSSERHSTQASRFHLGVVYSKKLPPSPVINSLFPFWHLLHSPSYYFLFVTYVSLSANILWIPWKQGLCQIHLALPITPSTVSCVIVIHSFCICSVLHMTIHSRHSINKNKWMNFLFLPPTFSLILLQSFLSSFWTFILSLFSFSQHQLPFFKPPKSIVCSLHPYSLAYILCKQTPKYEVTTIFQQPPKSVCSPDLPAELQSWMHGSLLHVSIERPMSKPNTTTHLSIKTSHQISLQILQIRLPQHFPFCHFLNSPWYAICQDDDNPEGGCEGEMWC